MFTTSKLKVPYNRTHYYEEINNRDILGLSTPQVGVLLKPWGSFPCTTSPHLLFHQGNVFGFLNCHGLFPTHFLLSCLNLDCEPKTRVKITSYVRSSSMIRFNYRKPSL
jgi:hypothetical protein